MNIENHEIALDGCRRLGGDRRTYGYDAYFPERRIEVERRSGKDRRKVNLGRQSGCERRMAENY